MAEVTQTELTTYRRAKKTSPPPKVIAVAAVRMKKDRLTCNGKSSGNSLQHFIEQVIVENQTLYSFIFNVHLCGQRSQ